MVKLIGGTVLTYGLFQETIQIAIQVNLFLANQPFFGGEFVMLESRQYQAL